MILKYLSFIVGIVWAYSIIRTQSIFSKKTGLIFKIFISNISWLTFIAAVYFGYKNFSIQLTLIGIIFSILIVHLGFKFLGKFLKSKYTERQLSISKSIFEYSLIVWVLYYLFY
mgnify:FL=1|jgi:hypothetical protein|tara:strand:+ start:99 stop:440 length:342 start_codon:yes stop_codon:yes gene_type:complete